MTAIMVATLGWSMGPVFIRYLSDAYDPISQAFVRYIGGAITLTFFCLIFYRSAFLGLLRRPWPVLGISIHNCVMQYTWTAGCYGSQATVAQLVVKINIVFIIVFAFVFFREERAVIKSPMYLTGTALSFVGVAAVMIKDASSFAVQLDTATLMLLLTALLWAIYAVWGKHLATGISPIPMFGVIAIWTAIGLGLLSLAFGRPLSILEAGAKANSIALLSGVIPIAMAHASFHYAQRRLGAAFCGAFLLITPMTTYLIAILVLPDETLSAAQWVGGAILLLGTFAVLRAEGRQAKERKLLAQRR